MPILNAMITADTTISRLMIYNQTYDMLHLSLFGDSYDVNVCDMLFSIRDERLPEVLKMLRYSTNSRKPHIL